MCTQHMYTQKHIFACTYLTTYKLTYVNALSLEVNKYNKSVIINESGGKPWIDKHHNIVDDT